MWKTAGKQNFRAPTSLDVEIQQNRVSTFRMSLFNYTVDSFILFYGIFRSDDAELNKANRTWCICVGWEGMRVRDNKVVKRQPAPSHLPGQIR